MKSTDGIVVKRTFLDIPNAAELAGFSVRHFRRIIEEEQIRIFQIGRMFFIWGGVLQVWKKSKKAKLFLFRSINFVEPATKLRRPHDVRPPILKLPPRPATLSFMTTNIETFEFQAEARQ